MTIEDMLERAKRNNAMNGIKEKDNVNHPDHYSSGGIECIEAIKASMTKEAYLGFLKGNVMKYLWRYEKKVAPEEDLKKAQWYLNVLTEEMGNAD